MPRKQRKRIEKEGVWYSVRGVELEFCSNTMTRAEFFGWIRSGARRLSIRWKPRSDFLESIRRPNQGTNKRCKWEYLCQECNKYYPLKKVEVDHKIECGKLNCFNDIGVFYERLFCEKDGFQCLCLTCHRKKTNKNRAGI